MKVKELPLSKVEVSVLAYFSKQHERSEFLRLSRILDVFLVTLSDYEFKLSHATEEKLRNEPLLPE